MNEPFLHIAVEPLWGDEFGLREMRAAHNQWAAFLTDDDADVLLRVEQLYDEYFEALDLLNNEAPRTSLFASCQRSPETIHLYRFVTCIDSARYLDPLSNRSPVRVAAHDTLWSRHEDHLIKIRQLMEHEDVQLIEPPARSRATGGWGDLVQAAVCLYFYHLLPSRDETNQMWADASKLIPAMVRRFPHVRSNLQAALFKHNPDAVDELSDLVRFFYLDGDVPSDPEISLGLLSDVAREMMGVSGDRQSFYRLAGPEILDRVLRDAPSWPAERLSALLDAIAHRPLAVRFQDLDTERDRIARSLAANEDRLEKNPNDSYAYGQVPALRIEADQIASGFEVWKHAKRTAAADVIRRSPTVMRSVDTILERVPTGLVSELAQVRELVKKPSVSTQKFPMPDAAGNDFGDFGLKLAVIGELMYRQHELGPEFDVREFAKEWTEREIDIEIDGYKMIPEVVQYFTNLAISTDLLDEVFELRFDVEAITALQQIMPFWDPGAGDTGVAITAAAVADLDLLPNLESVSGLHSLEVAVEVTAELEARGIPDS